MEKQIRRRTRRRSRKARLLVYGFAAAAFFAAGVMVGGLLQQEGHAESALAGQFAGGETGSLENRLWGESHGKVVLDAAFIDQREKYPTGCESVSAVMALNYAGVEVSVEEFIDLYLPQGEEPRPDDWGGYYSCDPNEVYIGNPYTEDGWGCFAPVICQAVERLLADRASPLQVADLSGMALADIAENYIAEGVPVILWATMYMEPPQVGATITIEGSGQRLDWITPEHCLLLVGFDGENYYFNDPLVGKAVAYGKEAVELAYQAQGSQALAVYGNTP